MLVFDTDHVAKKVSIENTYLLRPYFEKGKMAKLYVYDNPEWTTEMFALSSYKCYHLAMEGAPSPAPAAESKVKEQPPVTTKNTHETPPTK